jgi:hypothetical protein
VKWLRCMAGLQQGLTARSGARAGSQANSPRPLVKKRDFLNQRSGGIPLRRAKMDLVRSATRDAVFSRAGHSSYGYWACERAKMTAWPDGQDASRERKGYADHGSRRAGALAR